MRDLNEEETGQGLPEQEVLANDVGEPVGDGAKVRRSPWRAVTIFATAILSCVVTLLLVSPDRLKAALDGAWPTKITGILDTSSDGTSREPSIKTTSGGEQIRLAAATDANGTEFAAVEDVTQTFSVRDESVGGRQRRPSYLPEGASGYQTAGTVITIPEGQGRLLRLDEPAESVFIADAAIADLRVVSPDLVYVYGKLTGLTNLLAITAKTETRDGETTSEQQLTASVLLRIVRDSSAPNQARQELAPSAPVDITIFGKRPALQGRVRDVDEAVSVAEVAETYAPRDQPPINNTTLDGSNQINIRVRFAEISRNDLKSLGIDWNFAVNAGSFSLGIERTGATENPNLGINASAGNFDIGAFVEALRENGALTILAEPNLTAVTGETASFLAGGEVPVPVPAGQNAEVITVQYKPFGVSLDFTPTLVKRNRIGLRVKPEVSSISSVDTFSVQGFNLPSFRVSRAETVVEVASGQTFAIAGLFQREISRNIDKFPVLGDVPVLGALFKSERYTRNETELVILITPYLVEPVSDRRVATPLDRESPDAPWQASITSDPTDKGARLTDAEPAHTSGFILK